MLIRTQRLLLRPWREEDAGDLYKYAKDPDVGYPAGWPAHSNEAHSLQIIRTVLSVPETYAVCLKEDERPIGCIGLQMGEATDMTDRDDECELGYWLGKPFWGEGIIPEAGAALLRHAFLDLGMGTVWCGHYHGNKKSRRVMEKLGFLYHHTTEGLELPLLGETRTGHVTLLTRKDWLEHQHENHN